ncbi:HAD family phosphatase [Vagococcus coleopterorum]|uniref:HAD family phosphatase n=1 Tax=Vagococcus coleopterorum TaxID=2714946 RepID=A0A6G8ALD7_9ENTE|nr:HAD family hydrolase [Vagococcus coleopterorum]QIL45816.1 HAD family phosphatase [Vagococcus coleopterorum]
MKRKLIAFDIDGTLYTEKRTLLPNTLKALRELEEAGHFVTVATGRSYFTAKETLKELGVENYLLCNGAYSYENHELKHSFPIDKDELKTIVEVANENKMDILYQTERGVKQQKPFEDQEKRQNAVGFEHLNPSYEFDIDKEEAIYQAIMFCTRDQEKLFNGLLSELRFTRWLSDGVDIVSKDGSKAATLEVIAKDHGFEHEDIIAFGDGENDIEMLKLAGLGIVMGNASDHVKTFGDYITDTNDNDGIYKACQHFNLI